jgi:tetratricopeptide (TPR) repeat protein
MADYRFNISLHTFDASLLPSGSPAKGSKDYATAVHNFLQEQFAGFKGNARIVVSEDSILVEWTPPSSEQDPIVAAVMKLENGETIPAIVMLELLRQKHPSDVRLLYNLGLAYSNLGRLEEAKPILSESVRLNPGHVNSRVALGVVYGKEGRNQEAVDILEEVVSADPNNPWALRNLGACLLALKQVDRAISCLLRATQLNPQDQQAFFGLAEAYRAADNLKDADAAYRQVIVIDEFSSLAQQAKQQLSSLAHVGYLMRGGATGRPDAVMYCLSALKHFADLPEEEVQKIVFEIGMLGVKGFEINNTTQQYQLQSMPGKFSGLEMVCIMYVGFKQVAPEHAAFFDLSNAEAREMFEKQRGK